MTSTLKEIITVTKQSVSIRLKNGSQNAYIFHLFMMNSNKSNIIPFWNEIYEI